MVCIIYNLGLDHRTIWRPNGMYNIPGLDHRTIRRPNDMYNIPLGLDHRTIGNPMVCTCSSCTRPEDRGQPSGVRNISMDHRQPNGMHYQPLGLDHRTVGNPMVCTIYHLG